MRDGDRMSRDEFLRRCERRPELKLAEIIDGVVYLEPWRSTLHGRLHHFIGTWLVTYGGETPGCVSGGSGTWLMLQDAPQPDGAMWLLPEYGGQARRDGSFMAGAPEFAVEVSNTTARKDLGPKSRLYERAGVRV